MDDDYRKGRITIIDDDKELVEEMKDFLEERGFFVSFAHGGADGVEIIKREIPDVVILDIAMDDMDGRDVLVTLKKRNDTRDIPVIILTGAYSQQFDRDYGIELGAHEYVTKPCSGHALLRAIDKILHKRKKGEI